MSEVIQMYPEPHRAERLMEAADAGNLQVYVHWQGDVTQVLIGAYGKSPPTEAGLAAAIEIQRRFKENTDFHDAVVQYCVHLGLAVHDVSEPAWVFRPVDNAAS